LVNLFELYEEARTRQRQFHPIYVDVMKHFGVLCKSTKFMFLGSCLPHDNQFCLRIYYLCVKVRLVLNTTEGYSKYTYSARILYTLQLTLIYLTHNPFPCVFIERY